MGAFLNGIPGDEDDDELRPSARIASPGLPSSSMPAVNLRALPSPEATQRTGKAETELTRLQDAGSGISQIKNPIARGALKTLDTIGSIAAPRITAAIPGTQLHHERLIGQEQGQLGKDLGEENSEATLGKTGAETGEAEARTRNLDAATAAAGQPKPKEEKWSPFTGYTDSDGTPLIHEENSGQVVRADNKQPPTGYKLAAPKTEKTPNDFEQFYGDWLKDNNLPDSAHNRLMARKSYAAAGQAPQHDQRQLAVAPDGTVVELTPGMKVPQGTKTLSGDLAGAKPNAEELKRSEMAENMNENLDKLEEIVKRRPELFGPLAGRITQGKMFVGSDDPDIGALNTIKDQLGMAQQSAHSMRSAQHVEAAANSILNGFKNGPEAVNGSIKTARDSLKTFTKDVQEGNPSTKGGAGGETKGGPAVGAVEGGYKFKGGDPSKQENWEKVKQ